MDYRFWLEVQAPLEQSGRVARLWNLDQQTAPRSLIKVPAETHLEEMPVCMTVQTLLDQYDARSSTLAELGVPPEKVALWAQLIDGPIRLDPFILGQLGTEGIKLCLTDEVGIWGFQEGPTQYVPTHIEEIWLHDETEGKAAFTLMLGDGSSWEGHLVSIESVREDLETFANAESRLIYANSIIVAEVSLEAAKAAVNALLSNRNLEQILRPVEVEAIQPERPHAHFEIFLLHETGATMAHLGSILGAQEAAIRQTPQALRISCPDYHQNGISSLNSILLNIEKGAEALRQEGIRRQDISIAWHQVYAPHVRQELPAELMYRMSQLGLTLELDWRPAAMQKIRYQA